MTSCNVLLIDDEEDFVTSLAERLQLRGMQVKAAIDGKTGLQLLEREPFNVVILDVMMPGMGGLEVYQHIRAIRPLIPVILITGHGNKEEIINKTKQNAFDYLIKPFDIDELVKKIHEAALTH